ncbi:uncharacterized protein LOC123500500 [Portunus trituberculatus]|nr:uncharacterized protein LOC123500343 [Portunus trituberculatus]XP_045104981.1 uncharacterized protein LOC123500343 [Portunus trituberculatus]XP_045104982.1 uncharacterized protein LOC123500344 [Portunus trituberculatus]XP_045104983.1 uncharacterized protein LOC123500345 [Portunus trituberculatus]XP_045105143.1 uncharacterized protein LOC123500500 [Portunus trituberculatus]XP_045105144.1 uncharacterized protein LOC123500500 [Portunus trituberculatus]XP_045105145.1 uncharacterized protein LO
MRLTGLECEKVSSCQRRLLFRMASDPKPDQAQMLVEDTPASVTAAAATTATPPAPPATPLALNVDSDVLEFTREMVEQRSTARPGCHPPLEHICKPSLLRTLHPQHTP